MTPQYIRIVAIPPGDAPLWVREKWVGLCLPVADGRGVREAYVSGVLSGPRNLFLAFAWRFFGRLSRRSGYAVYLRDALSELEKSAPDAAAWWRQNVPQLQASGRKLLFRTQYCELVKSGYRANVQSALPIRRGAVTAPQFGLSSVTQIPKRQTAARTSSRLSPVTPAILLALVLFGWLWNWNHPIHPERQKLVHGTLVDWSLHTSYNGRTYLHRTPHLRITGYNEEFRIDPNLFHDLMGNRLPANLTKGAEIDITADAGQLAAPQHALLKPSIPIVWVNGMVVNGVTVLALRAVVQHERHQWIGWFGLAAMAAAYLGYTIINSRKQSANA